MWCIVLLIHKFNQYDLVFYYNDITCTSSIKIIHPQFQYNNSTVHVWYLNRYLIFRPFIFYGYILYISLHAVLQTLAGSQLAWYLRSVGRALHWNCSCHEFKLTVLCPNIFPTTSITSCWYCITVMWYIFCNLIKIQCTVEFQFFKPPRGTKIGSKNGLVWETSCKITVFDWGAETTFCSSFWEVKKKWGPGNRDSTVTKIGRFFFH